MRIIRFALLCINITLAGSAFAQSSPGPTALGDDEIESIVKKGVPAEISVTLTEKSEEAVALKSCQKTLAGLKVPKDCCKDPNCVRKAIANHDREQREAAQQKKRIEINHRICLEYGGGVDICSEPNRARSFVLEVRAQDKHLCKDVYNGPDAICNNVDSAHAYVKERENTKQRDANSASNAEATAEAAKRSAEEAQKTAKEALDKANNPPSSKVYIYQDNSGPKHHLDLGLTLVGHLEGAYGGGVYAAYRPPFAGERLELSVTAGAVVVVHNRLSLDNFDPITRAYGEANLGFRVVNFDKLSLAIGCSYSRIGKFSFDRLTAEMVGPFATLNIGSLQLHAAYLYNTGPIDGFLTPEWGVLMRVGFRFADFKF